ncbi:BnaCnng21290D [Brassica napus]|uniref:Receptor-like serine/threonine-protein kinase n=1 Tax=Brassica napus TaxID=3708 RepID=A0A078INX3_BRANA|nr:BnaCnng21290D [Brassica napus]
MRFLSCSMIYLFLVLQLQTLLVSSENIINGSIPVGESLTASESQQFSSSWRSPSGDFAFGFRKIQPNHGFTLSIWFDKIPDKTIVWHAQAVNTTTGLVPEGSKVTLTPDRGLVITDPRGQQHWISSLPPGSGSVSRGLITDAGNFRLLSKDSGEDLWLSFDHPTDTLLPTQSIEIGSNLSSRLTETSFKKGRFRLHLGDDGDLKLLVLNSKSLAETDVYFSYYESGTTEPNPGTRLVFNQSGYMYVLRSDNATRFGIKENVPTYIAAPFYISTGSEEALGNVACGFNSICILGDDQRPKCQCPEKFSLMDPSDEYGDCKPDFEMQTCGPENNKTENVHVNVYELMRVDRTNWPYGDYQRYKNYDEDTCRNACLSDCFCAAVVYGNDRVCWLKRFPLSFGQRAPNGNHDDRRDSYTLIKVLKGVVDVPVTRYRGRNSGWVFTYRELVVATGDFMDELGRGGFGIVYKGFITISGGDEVAVAVKKLDRVAQENEKEFKNEVRVIGQIHHKNLVRLIGFSNEGHSRLIVYEFIPHGTLADFLFRRPRPSWEDRKRIAVGIARGILYLHEDCKEQIIHCDIKPQNILLDASYNPRISDFGLAKLLMMNQTHTLTNIRGTKGYVAPEWFRNSPITSKVDVYSYGVMLLEIVCCKKAVDLDESVILIDWAYDCFRDRRLEDLIEDDLEAIEDMEMVERYVKIGIWCIQEESGLRPNMRNITQMLEGVTQVRDPPNPCPYSVLSCDEYLSCGPV